MYSPNGVMTSMVTSFDAGGKLDEAGIVENIEFQRGAGIKSIVILGGTGEPLSMTRAERERVIETSVAAAGADIDVVSSALVGSPEEVAHDIAIAAKHGARACMIAPPPFVRPSEEDVYKYITDLASASAIPLIVFNVPSRVGFLMSAGLVERMVRDIDILVGIKESSKDISLFSEIRRRTPETFACLQGSDILFLPSLALGAQGAILAAPAAFPEPFLHIEREMATGNRNAAMHWHLLVSPLLDLLYRESHPAILKHVIELRGYKVGLTRSPLYGPSEKLIHQARDCAASLLQQLDAATDG